MPEAEIRERLSEIASLYGSVELIESLNQYAVRRRQRPEPSKLLWSIYDTTSADTTAFQQTENAYA
jgi:hypothetical protein